MKTNNMKTIAFSSLKVLLLIAGTLPATTLYSQDEPVGKGMAPMLPVPGYVIYASGDTVWGKITWSLKYVENNPVEIKFTPDQGTKQILRAGEIIGFGNQVFVWADDEDAIKVPLPPEDYVSMPSFKKKEPVFMNRLINGRVTVFLNRSSISVSTSRVEKMSRITGIGFSYIPGEGLHIGPSYSVDYRLVEGWTRYSSYFVIKDGGEMIKVEKENYDQVRQQLFGDCQELDNELANNPDLLKFRNFMILAEVYNQLCR